MSILELAFESGEQTLSVRNFSVQEGLSTLFSANIVARSPKEDIDLESLVGKGAGFLMIGGLSVPRAWTGVVSQMELLEVDPPTPTSLGLSTYLVRIVPKMWLLTQRRSNRIFQQMSVPGIVEKILSEYDIKPNLKLSEAHAEHDYRVQYNETDFAFISRLLEEEGISYWFGQKQGGKGLVSDLILCDAPTRSAPRLPVRHVDHPNQATGEKEFITRVHLAEQVRPGATLIRDFDFEKPTFVLKGDADKAVPEAFYEQYVYEHGAFADPVKGKQRADILMQAERALKRHVTFDSNAHDLGPGTIFGIDNHPREDLAVSKTLLVLEALHEGTPDGEWQTSGDAVFAGVPYRTPQRTPRPKINGLQSAFVTGPAGEEIYCDEYGRVRVQFHWDRDGKYDEHSSCWVRVSQGWAGTAFGMMTIPRVGQEVLVGFWEGNPDEPVIVGRLYNGKSRVPYKLPDERTKSTWKSKTYKSDGFNEIMFEDAAGKELLYIQAQRDLSKLVKVNETERTGANRSQVVGANRSSVIGAVDTTLVGSKFELVMAKPKDFSKVEQGGEPEIEPLKTMIEMSDEKITMTTGKATVTLDGSTITLKADGDIQIKAGGEVVIHGGPFVKINC